MTEAVYFQLHDDMTFQDTVIEYKVSEIIVPVYQNAFLPGFKTESVPHLQQEVLQIVEDRLLQIVFSNQRPLIREIPM